MVSMPASAAPVSVGVLMLRTRFPRPPGDIGNAETFAGRALYRRVERATVAAVLRPEGPDPDLLADLIDAARALAAEGAGIIVTSCGFLGPAQVPIQAAVAVPVLTSALGLLPWLREAVGPDGRLGVLTFDADALTPAHWGATWDAGVSVAGLEDSAELGPVIREDRSTLDRTAAEADAVRAAETLRRRAGGALDAVVLECTNLGPYKTAIREASGAPVFDLAGWARWMAAGLAGAPPV